MSLNSEIAATLREITGHTRRILEGSYQNVNSLLTRANRGDNPPEVAELAETVGMMSVKVEAREFALEQKIEELEESIRLRQEFSLIFLIITLSLSVYGFVVATIMDAGLSEALNPVISMSLSVWLLGVSVVLVYRSGLPLDRFGLTTRRLWQSVRESLLVTFVVFLCLVTFKLWAVHSLDAFEGQAIFDFGTIDVWFWSYLFVAPTQEFVGRGVFQSSIQRMIHGRFRNVWAIVTVSMLFGVLHTFYSMPLAFAAVVGGIVWGWLYNRHQTIVGVSISHFLIGNILLLLGFWDVLV
ncbi:MAG: CPBP family intramembrane metalloprotease [Opitutales bacterium]|nr:CPBP family intramembrane metalloprotease [Opitutales bacterium]